MWKRLNNYVLQKSQKYEICRNQIMFFQSQNAFSAEVLPRTPLGKLTTLPNPSVSRGGDTPPLPFPFDLGASGSSILRPLEIKFQATPMLHKGTMKRETTLLFSVMLSHFVAYAAKIAVSKYQQLRDKYPVYCSVDNMKTRTDNENGLFNVSSGVLQSLWSVVNPGITSNGK